MSFPRAVVGWITNGTHVVTVSRRNRPHDLGLPGGKVEKGETRLQALAREVYEEGSNILLVCSNNFDAIMRLDQLGMLSSGFSIPVSDSR